jgi:hypothetical protein
MVVGNRTDFLTVTQGRQGEESLVTARTEQSEDGIFVETPSFATPLPEHRLDKPQCESSESGRVSLIADRAASAGCSRRVRA